MPTDAKIRKVLVVGSGPIEIGQAAEFDYAGTQACEALKEAGVEVVLINSNPATIMTDPNVADVVYIEPLNQETMKRIIRRERPQALLASTGGQTGLNLARELAEGGVLADWDVKLLGTDIDGIRRSEDRQAFRQCMLDIGEPIPMSETVSSVAGALQFAERTGYPLVIRPAYTLGGAGGGMVRNEDELRARVAQGIGFSPIGQVLMEQSIAGMRELEYEVIRDSSDSSVVVCDMENMDPVGVHTGDSIVSAPVQTLSREDNEYLKRAAQRIASNLGVIGSCNVQFAFDSSASYYVIEVNPRVSRSSALASKATGYPIARVAAAVSLGLTLAELGMEQAPAIDYVVAKIPRWPFDKFTDANRTLGTQMKAVGEVMALGSTWQEALQKAVRSLEGPNTQLFHGRFRQWRTDALLKNMKEPDDQRLFTLAEYLRRGGSCHTAAEQTGMHAWFIDQLWQLADACSRWESQGLRPAEVQQAKAMGFSDASLASLSGLEEEHFRAMRWELGIRPGLRWVSGGREPYRFLSYHRTQTGEAAPTSNPTAVVLGSGPIRIGQGVEFDYCTVHASWALRAEQWTSVIVNNNPETVSTDSTTSDRLYFEPLTEEDVLEVCYLEQPDGVVTQFGGQTAIGLAEPLKRAGYHILGTAWEDTAGMEDRRRFDDAMETLGLKRPRGVTVSDAEAARQAAAALEYPVVVRPSYVLGGQGMQVIADEGQLLQYLAAFHSDKGWPLLLDQYLPGKELEVDAVCDGYEAFVPGVMEHLERAGVHSGDSSAVYPSQSVSAELLQEIRRCTTTIARHFNVRGLLNIQFVAFQDSLYVLEVNPRSSRTIPFLSKASGLPMAALAAKAVLGRPVSELLSGLRWQFNEPAQVSVKMPVFSFAKLEELDTTLGPEMKSTGEAMGMGPTLNKALYKGFSAIGIESQSIGRVLLTVADRDKEQLPALARILRQLDCHLTATQGTASYLEQHGIPCSVVEKLHVGPTILELLASQNVDLVINTFTLGKQKQRDGFRMRRTAAERGIPCFTNLETAWAFLDVLLDRDLGLQSLQKEAVQWN